MRPVPTMPTPPMRVAPGTDTVQMPRRSGLTGKLPWLAAAAALVLAVGMSIFYAAERSARIEASAGADTARAQLTSALNQVARSDSLIATLLAPQCANDYARGPGPPALGAPLLQPRPPRCRGCRFRFATCSQRPHVSALGHRDRTGTGQPGHVQHTGRFSRGDNAARAVRRTIRNVAAVTEEPAGGSPQPTTQPFLIGTLPAR